MHTQTASKITHEFKLNNARCILRFQICEEHLYRINDIQLTNNTVLIIKEQ